MTAQQTKSAATIQAAITNVIRFHRGRGNCPMSAWIQDARVYFCGKTLGVSVRFSDTGARASVLVPGHIVRKGSLAILRHAFGIRVAARKAAKAAKAAGPVITKPAAPAPKELTVVPTYEALYDRQIREMYKGSFRCPWA